MCCCIVTNQLGCFESCSPIKTGIVAGATGVWKARVCFNGVWLKKDVQATNGQEIMIPNDFPEDVLLKMQMIKPDGVIHPDAEHPATFSFTVKLTIQL